jgi:hypothetical protein
MESTARRIPEPILAEKEPARRPSYRAYQLLQVVFVVLPIAAGTDKFFHYLCNWDMYLAPRIADAFPGGATTFLYGVGVVEIVAGIVVAVAPAFGAYLVAVWLWGIISNLFLIPGYFDIAVRDFGLSIGALALGQLAEEYGSPPATLESHAVGASATERRGR